MNDLNSSYLRFFLIKMLSILLFSSVYSQDQIRPHIANYEVNVRGIKGSLDTILNIKENMLQVMEHLVEAIGKLEKMEKT